MKTAIITSPDMTPAILVHADTAHAMSIGLVQGGGASSQSVHAMLNHLLSASSNASMMAAALSIMAVLALLASRLNRRLGTTLIMACIGFYGLAALYAIQAVAAMRP